MILLVDNYDSFVHNLARYFQRLGQATRVVRNDELTVGQVKDQRPQAVVISPGPCTPDEAGCSLALVRELHREIPILGVCLGHQVIAQALGAQIVRAPEPVHGRPWKIYHDGQDLFAGLPSPFDACRYHSLVVDEASIPPSLTTTAWTAEGVVMALTHRDYPVVGLQFHPESILTDSGYRLLAAFLNKSGISVPQPLPTIQHELLQPAAWTMRNRPVTF